MISIETTVPGAVYSPGRSRRLFSDLGRLLLGIVLICALGIPARAQDSKSGASSNRSPGTEASSAAGSTTNSMDALDSKRKLVIGDRLSYRVLQERGEPQGLIITDSGDAEVPLIGRVPAAGKTCRQFAQEIKVLLERDYFYHATVIIFLNAASPRSRGVVYILGPVKNQGPQEIPLEGGFTLSKAILRAGSFADFANGHKVKLIRKTAAGEPKTTIHDVADILRGKAGEDPELQPDDMVIVPEKFINIL